MLLWKWEGVGGFGEDWEEELKKHPEPKKESMELTLAVLLVFWEPREQNE